MAKKRRQARIPTPEWDRHQSTLGRQLLEHSFQFYGAVAIGLLLVVALGIVGYAFLNDYIQDQRRPGSTALQIEDTRFNLEYFSNRLKMYKDQFGAQNSSAADPQAALPAVTSIIVQEEIARRFASEHGVSVTGDEIDEAIASRLAVALSDETFEVVFEQELARTGLTEQQYRDMVEASVLQDKLNDGFQEEVPASAESIRYRQILVSQDERAQELRDEIEDGGDFAALAKENSLDVATKDEGGEVGWVPRGALDASLEELLFNLDVGEITTIPVPAGVYVVELEEKADDRAVDEEQKPQLAARALERWVQEKRESLEIVNALDLSEGDTDKIEWVVSRAYES